jgi:hypothetical protein
MNVRKLIQRRIRSKEKGVDLFADVNAAIAANVGETGSSSTHVSSSQRIVQKDGETVVSERTHRREETK